MKLSQGSLLNLLLMPSPTLHTTPTLSPQDPCDIFLNSA